MTKSSLITPRTLKGFRDFLPELMIPREAIMDTARRVYRSYGFAPIDTPALEYLEILTGKGGQETDNYHAAEVAGNRAHSQSASSRVRPAAKEEVVPSVTCSGEVRTPNCWKTLGEGKEVEKAPGIAISGVGRGKMDILGSKMLPMAPP